MFNVEIWLILKCNLQFSSILFLKENISCSRGRSSKQSLITSLPMSGPLTFTVYYRIDNANFRNKYNLDWSLIYVTGSESEILVTNSNFTEKSINS